MAEEIPPLGPGMKTKIMAGLIVHNEVVADATSDSSRYAKVRASKNALELLHGLAPFEYRRKYGCDCKLEDIDDEDAVMGADVGTAI